MMKILLISVKSNVSRGGIAVWTERFLSKCENHDMDCDLVNTELVGQRAERQISKRSFTDEFTRTLRILKDLKKRLKEGKYDAAHLNTSCGNFGLFRDYFVAKRIKKKNIKLVVHFHCDIPFWVHSSLNRRFLGKLAALADERLVLCENSRAYLEKNYNVSSEKLPNFIDEAHIAVTDKEIAKELRSVVFVGRVAYAKGVGEIYELAKRFPDIKFRLVGDVSDTVSGWEKPGNVELLGGVDHAKVLEYMDGADAFLLPSHSEGFSLALTEAMARALPSIATDVGANSDMLDGDCGLVVAKGDVDAMASAIEKMKDPELRRKMSANAWSKVKEQYSSEVIMKKIKEYYR